jgi:hypothetical protein
VFAEYLLGFEGTPCVILSGVLKQHQTIKFACRGLSVWISRPRRLGASWLGFR